MADMTHEPKRGGRRLHHALTAKGVQTASAPGRYFDGHGLYLLVEPTGAKRWKQRLAVHGKRRELGLGGIPARDAGDGPRGGARQPAEGPCRR